MVGSADAHRLQYARALAKADSYASSVGNREAPYYGLERCQRENQHVFACRASLSYYAVVNGSGCYYDGHAWFRQDYLIYVRLARNSYRLSASAPFSSYGEPYIVRCAPTENPGTPSG